MTDRESVLSKVQWMIERLTRPLSESDLKCGWIDKSRLAFLTYFQDLEKKLNDGEPIPALNISRGMDSWGIIGGDLCEKGAEISVALKKLRGFPSA